MLVSSHIACSPILRIQTEETEWCLQLQGVVFQSAPIHSWRIGGSNMPLAASTSIPQEFQFRSWLSRRTRAQWLLGAVCLALAVGIVAAYGLSSWQDASIRRSVDWVEHTHDVIKVMDDILEDVEDVETGMRGFLVTGEASYLEPSPAGPRVNQGPSRQGAKAGRRQRAPAGSPASLGSAAARQTAVGRARRRTGPER